MTVFAQSMQSTDLDRLHAVCGQVQADASTCDKQGRLTISRVLELICSSTQVSVQQCALLLGWLEHTWEMPSDRQQAGKVPQGL